MSEEEVNKEPMWMDDGKEKRYSLKQAESHLLKLLGEFHLVCELEEVRHGVRTFT